MTVVMHHHIYKNAGSTVDWILHQNFPGNVLHIEGDRPNARLTPAEVEEAARPYPDHKAITSHCAPLPDADSQWAQFHLTLLRDPIDRLYSMYRFERRRKVDGPARASAKQRCFKGYCEWWLKIPDPIISNWQARCCTPQQRLAGAGGSRAASGWGVDLEEARAAITSCGYVGTVEDFDKSMLLFECGMQQHGYSFDAAYRRLNVAPDGPANEDDMRDYFVDLLGRSIYERLLEINALDYELIEIARQLVRTRFSMLEDGETKLRDFRARCQQKAEADPTSFVRVLDRDERIFVAGSASG